jgi:hypothetical protein
VQLEDRILPVVEAGIRGEIGSAYEPGGLDSLQLIGNGSGA